MTLEERTAIFITCVNLVDHVKDTAKRIDEIAYRRACMENSMDIQAIRATLMTAADRASLDEAENLVRGNLLLQTVFKLEECMLTHSLGLSGMSGFKYMQRLLHALADIVVVLYHYGKKLLVDIKAIDRGEKKLPPRVKPGHADGRPSPLGLYVKSADERTLDDIMAEGFLAALHAMESGDNDNSWSWE